MMLMLTIRATHLLLPTLLSSSYYPITSAFKAIHYNRLNYDICKSRRCHNHHTTCCNNRAATRLLHASSSDDNDDEPTDDYDDDTPPDVDIRNFSTTQKMHSFGLNGRSAPNQRKAIGKGANAKASVFVCTNCGSEFVKWLGRCPTCQEWNTIQEFSVRRAAVNSRARPTFAKSSSTDGSGTWLGGVEGGGLTPVKISDVLKAAGADGNIDPAANNRERRLMVPNNDEFNSVLGGGIMSGSLTLVGGDPGVGKSTLLLQVAGAIASLSAPRRGIGMGMDEDELSMDDDSNKSIIGPVLYVSGEENTWQIASRAARLGVDQVSELLLLCDSDADLIAETVANPRGENQKMPSLVVIDSIQTMVCEAGGSSSAGGVTQVKETVALFLRLAKSTGVPIMLVGHVTKTGGVAGPRTVEHMVDCVLYLEGDRTGNDASLRMLRATKNRFGSSDEVGVYEMGSSAYGQQSGSLIPVSDPSSRFLSGRIDTADIDGCAVSLVLEGTRPMTAEIQALVTTSSTPGGSGRRTVDGISTSRLLLILAVLSKRCGISLNRHDVFINVVGGIRLNSFGCNDGSSSDLAIAAAAVSSLLSIPIRADTAFVGEIGLVGEIRSIRSVQKRISEAERMGFSRIITPSKYQNKRSKARYQKSSSTSSSSSSGIEVIECGDLLSALNEGLVMKIPSAKKRRALKRKQSDVLQARRKRKNIGTDSREMEVFDDDEFDDDDFNVDFA